MMKKEFKPFGFEACVKFIKVDLSELRDPPPYNDLYEAWVFAKTCATYICSAQKMAEGWFAGLVTTAAAAEEASLVEWGEAWDEFQYQYVVDMTWVDYFDYSKTMAESIPVKMEPLTIESDKDFQDQMNDAVSFVREDIERYLDAWLNRSNQTKEA
jgi:hypothetical protein